MLCSDNIIIAEVLTDRIRSIQYIYAQFKAEDAVVLCVPRTPLETFQQVWDIPSDNCIFATVFSSCRLYTLI